MFDDRHHAGRELAGHLTAWADRDDVIVLGLPRGGIPVAYEVAAALKAPLEAFVVRKLGLPGHPELAMGAIASGGIRVLNDDVVSYYRVPDAVVDAVALGEQLELERRDRAYGDRREATALNDKVVLLVDDGLATGATMKAAVAAVRSRGPKRVVVAVPVGAPESCRELAQAADEVVCPLQPANFNAVGLWYRSFPQTDDEEVSHLLQAASDQ